MSLDATLMTKSETASLAAALTLALLNSKSTAACGRATAARRRRHIGDRLGTPARITCTQPQASPLWWFGEEPLSHANAPMSYL